MSRIALSPFLRTRPCQSDEEEFFPWQVFPSPGPGFLHTYMKDHKHPLCQTISDLRGSKSSLVTEFLNLDMKTVISCQEFSQCKSTPRSPQFVIIHSSLGPLKPLFPPHSKQRGDLKHRNTLLTETVPL